MPRGIYDRTKFRKENKDTMTTPTSQDEPTFVPGAEVPLGVSDAASLLFKDRSGAKLGGGPSEGSVNFAAVTAGAIQSVKDAEERAVSEQQGDSVPRGTPKTGG